MTQVPLARPDITEAEVEAVVRVLRSGHLALGPIAVEFERAMAERTGRAHAVAVSSGTSGLHIALLERGVGPGDLVLTTPYSFISSANVALFCGATPVFVDVDPVTGNIDDAAACDAIERLATGEGQALLPPSARGVPQGTLRAVIPVHVFGVPAKIAGLRALARDRQIAVIDDACEAIGAIDDGRPVGAAGDAAVYAFYPNKQMTTGEGGVVATDDPDAAAMYWSLRNQGRGTGDEWLTHVRLGFNYRMDDMSAALGLVQLERLDGMLAERRRVAAAYAERLADVEGLALPPQEATASWFVYVVRLDPRFERDKVAALLEGHGVPTRPYFPAIHLQPFYREAFGYAPGAFPVAEDLSARSMAIPFFGGMTDGQIDQVCDALRVVLRDGG